MKNSINTKRFVEKLQESAFTYTLISIIIGFIVGAIALLIAGYNPIESYGKLFGVIFRSTKNISYSFIEYSVPYILTGLSVAFAFKTGVFNIGAEGQYVMGSVAAMLVGAFVKAPAFIHIPLCIIAALAAGHHNAYKRYKHAEVRLGRKAGQPIGYGYLCRIGNGYGPGFAVAHVHAVKIYYKV